MRRSFSLIELLVALSVLAVVSAIIVPKFINVRKEADETVAKQIESQLNTTFSQWLSLGGVISGAGSGLTTGDILTLLTSTGAQSISDSGQTASDVSSPMAQEIRVAPMPGNLAQNQKVVISGNTIIAYNPGTQSFVTCTNADLGMPEGVTVQNAITYVPNSNGSVTVFLSCSDGHVYPSTGQYTITP
jgi:prepilin-type N-terminal cleavage/methylation domain-containing protein